jgi:hypothetical protein
MISNIGFYSIIFQLVAGIMPLVLIYKKKYTKNKEFTIFLASSAITTLILFVTGLLKMNNLIVFNLYQAIAISSLSFYYFKITTRKNLKYFSLILGILCFSAFLLELSKTSFIEKTLVYKNICFILLTIVFFIDYLGLEKYKDESKTYLIISSSIFLYNSFNYLLVFNITELMKQDLWFVHNILEGLSKLLIAYAFWKLPRTFIS